MVHAVSSLGEHKTPNGLVTEFGYREDGNGRALIDHGHVDTILTSAEGGLGPMPTRLLSSELGIPRGELITWANEISREHDVKLVALQSRVPASKLKGVLLLPFGTAQCYKELVLPENRGAPYRDFFYNVSFEAISYAIHHWHSRRFAANHLSGCGQASHVDFALCQCEALIHKLDESPSDKVESFCFLGCSCIKKKTLEGFDLRLPGLVGKHRPIAKEFQELPNGSGHIFTLHWPRVN